MIIIVLSGREEKALNEKYRTGVTARKVNTACIAEIEKRIEVDF